jgi:hypothetical protein
MKSITKSRLNAIHNAGSEILTYDSWSQLPEEQIEEHHVIGQLLIDNSREVLKLLFRLKNNK